MTPVQNERIVKAFELIAEALHGFAQAHWKLVDAIHDLQIAPIGHEDQPFIGHAECFYNNES
jgi:hypothetical protein